VRLLEVESIGVSLEQVQVVSEDRFGSIVARARRPGSVERRAHDRVRAYRRRTAPARGASEKLGEARGPSAPREIARAAIGARVVSIEACENGHELLRRRVELCQAHSTKEKPREVVFVVDRSNALDASLTSIDPARPCQPRRSDERVRDVEGERVVTNELRSTRGRAGTRFCPS